VNQFILSSNRRILCNDGLDLVILSGFCIGLFALSQRSIGRHWITDG
jgi:uncharacterized metal-binding protein